MENSEYMEITSDNGPECTTRDICEFLTYFSSNTYAVSNRQNEPRSFMVDALKLMERDYKIARIENLDGSLCPQYPEIIPIIESPRQVTTIYENEEEMNTTATDIVATRALFDSAKLARCRQRFPIPVILINGKYVCRSSTLASEAEMCYRTGLGNVGSYDILKSVKGFWWPSEGLTPEPEPDNEEVPQGPGPYDNDRRAQTICNKARGFDIKLLRHFNINTIVDIMVEKRKVKHGLYVSASEKVDINRYSCFKVLSLPYPGCEFFKSYHDAMFNAEGLVYDWNNPANDAILSVPDDSINRNLAIPWQQYKEWDLVLITQNYLKYILRRIQEDQSGLLLHCISGWDRTPLFMSLIRLSLWADSLIHTSLNEHEILYFTLVYDWYLFGHHLHNRVFKNEEIMAFCFDFLKYVVNDEFSLKSFKKKHSDEMKCDEARSPSRTSASSSSDEISGSKKKKPSPDNTLFTASENSNDSTMDIIFEDISPPEIFHIDGYPIEGPCSGEDGCLKAKVLSPTSVTQKRTSPIPVAGATVSGGTPSRRQRSESTCSTASTVSWQLITESGSVEKEQLTLRPQRQQRLEKVRSLFNSCYQKTVKNESFGPPPKWFFEEFAGNVSQLADWSRWLEIPHIFSDIINNGNETGEETNGNNYNNGFEILPDQENP